MTVVNRDGKFQLICCDKCQRWMVLNDSDEPPQKCHFCGAKLKYNILSKTGE